MPYQFYYLQYLLRKQKSTFFLLLGTTYVFSHSSGVDIICLPLLNVSVLGEAHVQLLLFHTILFNSVLFLCISHTYIK